MLASAWGHTLSNLERRGKLEPLLVFSPRSTRLLPIECAKSFTTAHTTTTVAKKSVRYTRAFPKPLLNSLSSDLIRGL